MKKLLCLFLFLLSPATALAQTGLTQPTQLPPECGTMAAFGDAMGGVAAEVATSMIAVFSTLIPNVGITIQDEQTNLQLSWPLTFAFGWASGQTVVEQRCSSSTYESKINRVILEPILRFNDDFDTTFHLRPAYRLLYRESNSMVGFGAGFGSTIDFSPDIDASLSPELVVSFGECCTPSYVTVAARLDHYTQTDRTAFTLQIGWTYF